MSLKDIESYPQLSMFVLYMTFIVRKIINRLASRTVMEHGSFTSQFNRQ